MSKVIAIVSFKLPQPQTLDQATATFQATAPKYLNLAGLLRKNYFLTEDGMRAGACTRRSGRPSSEASTGTNLRSFSSIRRCWWTTNRAGSSAFERALRPWPKPNWALRAAWCARMRLAANCIGITPFR